MNGYFTFLNTDKARTEGIEFDMGLDFLDYFTISGQYTYLDARDLNTDEQLSGTAEHTYLAQLSFAQPKWGVTATLWNEWVDGMRISSRSDEQ